MAKKFKYSEEDMKSALADINSKVLSLNKAAAQYGIPKSTLSMKLSGKSPPIRKMGPSSFLTVEEENKIKSWILNNAKLGFPLRTDDVKDSVQKVIIDFPRHVPFKNSRPGDKWMKLFLKRNPEIVKRNTEVISKARAAVTEDKIRNWFQELDTYLVSEGSHDVLYDATRIFNCDETGLQTCPKSGRVLGPKSLKDFYEIAPGKEKECITVLCTYGADGSIPPPMVIYPYKRLPSSIMTTFPEEWIIGRSDSGWMVSSTFYEYISNGFYSWLLNEKIKFPVILFLDGHKSHLSLELAEFCANHEIILYCLPPNSTHIMQPCDVSIFKPLKASWKNVIGNNKRQGITITKTNFVKYFKTAFTSVRTSCITNGFRKCGLYPFDPNAVDYSKCISSRRNTIFPTSKYNKPTHEEHCIFLKVLDNYIGTTTIEIFKEKLKNSQIEISNVPSLFDFWAKFKNTNELFDIDNLPIEIACDELNENSDCWLETFDLAAALEPMDSSPKQMIVTADDKLFTEDCITVQHDKESKSTEDNLLYCINETENNVRINYVEDNTSTEEDILLPTEIENCNMVKYGEDNLLYINETENNVRINYVEDNTSTEEDILLPTEIENCNMVKYGEDNLLYINETENNVRINYVEDNTSTEEDILLPTEIENCNTVKYGKENLSTKDNLLYYIDINETENKIVNEETEDIVTDVLTNDQEHLITNKSRNYESKSIDEAWEKHLFWPRPDNIDLNKKNKQTRIKLPYAVSAIQWREHHSKIEQAKLQKEEELCLKRKRREEIKNAKLNESSQKIKKKPKQKKIIKKSKKHSDSSENDADCLYCNEPYSLSKSGESWIKCCSCAGWAHELCAGIEKTVAFICDMCR